MKTGLIRTSIALVTLVALLLTLGVGSSANSAQRYWSGSSSAGTLITDRSSPITVLHETLTFNVAEFPSNYYSSEDQLSKYTGSVSAEYLLHNPTSETISATLAFPFGTEPDYLSYSFDEDGNPIILYNSSAYGAYIGGEPIETTLRHTFSLGYDDFSVEDDLPKLSDGFVNDPFFSPESAIHRQVYSVYGIHSTAKSACVGFKWHVDTTKTRVQTDGKVQYVSTENDGYTIYLWVANGEKITFDFFGDAPTEDPEIHFYNDSFHYNEIYAAAERIDNTANYSCFSDYAMTGYEAESGILEHDWYNAFVDMINYYTTDGVIEYYYSDLSYYLMRWYEYEVTIEPGETIVNCVKAPLYPSIDSGYSPPIYTYNYLLSPAKSWTSFGTLDIIINSPYHLTSSSVEFDKTDSGYKAHLEGLPDGELEFDMCEDEEPKHTAGVYGAMSIVLLIFAGIYSIIAAPFIFIKDTFVAAYEWIASLFIK